MLQGRLFAYADTHRHRLGPNYAQIPVNAPHVAIKMANTLRDGFSNHDKSQNGAPNYFPNSFNGVHESGEAELSIFTLQGNVQRYNSADDDNHSQVTTFWNSVLKPEERKRLVDNIVGSLKQAEPFIQERAIQNFSKVHPDFGNMLKEGLNWQKGKRMNQLQPQTKTNNYNRESKCNL